MHETMKEADHYCLNNQINCDLKEVVFGVIV